LETQGYKVIRFWNNDVMNRIDSVLAVIWDVVNDGNEQSAVPTRVFGEEYDR
jgi:very-short-patch-repair endonuclease